MICRQKMLKYFLNHISQNTSFFLSIFSVCLPFSVFPLPYYWPAPSSIHRGLEWSQCLKRLIVPWLFFVLCLSANFLIFLLLTSSFIDWLLCYWPAPSSIHRGLEWSQCLNRLIACSLFFVCLEANFLIFLLLTSSFIVLSPLLLARSPEYPQRIRVASVFEPFVLCLHVCKQIFSFFFSSSSSL